MVYTELIDNPQRMLCVSLESLYSNVNYDTIFEMTISNEHF